MDAQVVRSRLETILEDLDRTASALSAEGADDEGLDNESSASDEANELVDAGREEASLEVIEAQQGRVREALARLDAGTYGRCVDCGKEIPAARLEAKPESERCVEDQQKYEALR